MRKFKNLTFKKKVKRIAYDLWWSIKRPFKDGWYWFRCHTYTKYHMLDLRTKEYRYGWMDQDTRMFHACFNCLVYFVEQEEGLPHLKYQSEPWEQFIETEEDKQKELERQKEAERIYNEVKMLYDWWKEGRAKEEDEIHHITDGLDLSLHFEEIPGSEYSRLVDKNNINQHPKWLEYCRRSDEFKKKDDEMLDRLIKVRHYLWT